MTVELNSVVQEVIIDDSKAVSGSARVVGAMESMAVAADKATAANTRQASGFAALDAALKTSAPAQESALRRLNSWKAQADPVEASLQRLSRAEQDLNRAISQGLSDQAQKAQIMDALWKKTLGAAEAQEKLNAAVRAQSAQDSFNSQLGVKSDFGGAVRATDIAAYGQELDKVRAKYVPLAAAQQAYIAELNDIRQSVKAGAISQAEGAIAITRTKDSFAQQVRSIKESTDATTKNSGAIKLQNYQLANLSYQINDVVSGIAMGQSPMMLLTQQGGQFVQIFGGIGNTFKWAMSFVTPFRVGMVALGTAFALVASRATDIEGETRKMSVALRGYGKDAEITTGQIHKLIESMRDLGVSKTDARLAASAAISVPGASNAAISSALSNAPDFAAAYGVSIDDAAKKLTELGTTGYAAIKKLDEAYRFLSVDQAQLIRELSEHGDKAGAVALAYQALEARIGGAAINAMSPMKRATTELSRSWQDLIDTVANTQPVLDVINSLSGGFKALAAIFSGDLTGAWDGWVQHVQNDPIMGFLEKIVNYKPGLDALAANTPEMMGGGGSAHSAPFRAPKAADQSTIAASVLDAETAAYERQIRVLNTAAGSRQILQARIEAESQAMIAGKNAVEIKTAGDRAAGVATAQLSAAANDNLATVKAQTQGTIALAAAGGVSTEAGMRAQAEMQARAAKLQNVTVNEAKLTEELLEQAKAQVHLQAVEDLKRAKLDTDIARMKAQAAQISDPQSQHAEELAITRQQKRNDLEIAYKSDVIEINKHMAEFDRKTVYDEQARFWNDVRDKAQAISGDISQFLVDGFVNAENGGKSMFKNLWDGALQGAKRLIANIAAEFLKTQFIMPVLTQVIGGNAGLASMLGIVQPNGAAGSMGGGTNILSSLSSLSSLFGGGSSGSGGMLSGVGSWIGGLFGGGSTATAAAQAAGTVGAHAAPYISGAASSASGIGGAASAAYAIPVWGWIAAAAATVKSFVEGSDPKSIKGGISTLLGPSLEEWQTAPRRSMANAMDPIGTMLTDFGLPKFLSLGGIVGSLLGADKKPTDAFANTSIDLLTGIISKAQYNPREASQTNIDASQQLANAFLEIQKQMLALTGGTGPSGAFAKVGSRDGIVVGVGPNADFWKANYGGQAGVATGTFQDPTAALNFMVQALAKQITGIADADIQKVLTRGGTSEEILSNLTLVKSILDATAEAANPLVVALKAVNDNFDTMDKQARDLGLSTDLLTKLEAVRQKQLVEVNATASLGTYQSVSGALSQLNDWMTGQQLSDASSLNPLGRQSLAQGSFDDLLKAVNDNGDLSKVGALTSSASNLLSIARQNYGSTAGFTSVEMQVQQALSNLGLSFSSQESIGDQVSKAIALSTQTNTEKLEELKAEIVKMRLAFSLMSQKLAA